MAEKKEGGGISQDQVRELMEKHPTHLFINLKLCPEIYNFVPFPR